MQDRYTGDIGDFGKYSLLRYILDRADINLGINWYLVSNEVHNDDGKHIAYLLDEKLNHKEYKSCDPDLYDILHEIVRPIRKDNGNIVSTGIRRVDRIEKSRIFNKDNVSFFNKLNITDYPCQRRKTIIFPFMSFQFISFPVKRSYRFALWK